MNHSPPRLGLTRDLSRRQHPLALLLVALVALFAPLVFLIFGLRQQQDQASLIAQQAADLLAQENQGNSQLWKYNTPKLFGHFLHYNSNSHVERLEVVDSQEQRINADSAALASDAFTNLWRSAPIIIDARQVGSVWTALNCGWLYRDAALIFFLFLGSGWLLTGLMVWIPQRSLSRAEEHIASLLNELNTSKQNLADLNQNLEQQVSARSEQLALAYRDLQGQDRRLQELSQRAMLLQEHERRLIARDLHDAVGGALTAIRINLQLIGSQSTGHSPDSLIDKTIALTDETLEEVRRVVTSMGPAILDELGLTAAINHLLDDVEERSGLKLLRELQPVLGILSPAVENACFRILQEALTNVIKHAQARAVWVRLRTLDDRLLLEVEDDGCGFLPAKSNGQTGHGLIGIQERATLLLGRVQLTSSPGKGTWLKVDLPQTAVIQNEAYPKEGKELL